MRFLAGIFLLLALLGEFILAGALIQTHNESVALEAEVNHFQDIIRQREFLWMRDLPIVASEITYSAQERAPMDPELKESLRQWFKSDLEIYKDVIEKDPKAQKYWEQVESSARRWMNVTDKFISIVDKAGVERNETNAQFNTAYDRMRRALNNSEGAVNDPFEMPDATVKKWQENGIQFENLLLWTIAYNTVLALMLAAFCKWGSENALRPLNDKTSFFQKCLMLVWTPLVFEFIFLSMLAVMFYHSNAEMMRVQEYLSQESDIKAVSAKIDALQVEGDPTGQLMPSILADIARMKERVKDRQQQIASFEEIEKCIKAIQQIAEKTQRLDDKDKKEIQRLDHLKEANLLRAALYMTYCSPKIGQQKLLAGRQEILRRQIETNRTLQYGLVLGVAFNILLAYLLNSYFNRATSNKLARITGNIELMAERKPLLGKLNGQDEFAQLDNTFHEMSSLLIETINKERAVIDNASDVICALESNLTFAMLNPAVSETWGVDPQVLNGKKVDEILHEADRSATIAALKRAKENPGLFSFENRVERPELPVADMLWSVQWSAAENQLFCVVQDITERKQIERLKQEFVAMVSHDLRTPLTASTMFLELLEVGVYGELNEEGQKQLQGCTAEVTRLIALIKDLLDVERLESGKIEFEFTAVDVEDIIDAGVDTLRPYSKEKALTIKKDYPEEARLIGDEDRLSQAFIAILANAVNLSPANSTLEIIADQSDDLIEMRILFNLDDQSLKFDNGVFEKYRRSELPDPSSCGGSRLGLALAKAIIERHSGELSVRLTDGGDNRNKLVAFDISLPITRRNDTQLTVNVSVTELSAV